MAWIIILSIIALPLLEVAIFIKAAQAIGILPMIAAAILAGIAGLALWKHQGMQTVMRARTSLDRGEVPVAEVFDGLCLLIAGGLLLLPGFLSDALALSLLLPPVRAALRGLMARQVVVAAPPPRQQPGPKVIDVDYQEVEDPRDPPPRG